MAIGFSYAGTIYIVLDDENMERIRQNDPFDFTANQSVQLGTIRIPPEIVVAYAGKDEYEQMLSMTPADMVKYLRRGYKETASDHERAIYLGTLPKA